MPQISTAIHFNNFDYPWSSNTQYWNNTTPEYGERDWVQADVSSPGIISVSLYCRAMPGRLLGDFFDFFSKNEFLWFKIFFTRYSRRITKILRVRSFALEGSGVINYDIFTFPMYKYVLKSEVSDVLRTDDEEYVINVFDPTPDGVGIQY